MRAELVRLDLTLRRRSIVAYALGLGLYLVVILALYPQFRHSTSLNQFTKGNNAAAALFGVTGSITSPTGWLNANVYGNFLPLVLLILAIGYATSSIAGQNEEGLLGLVASNPVSRRSLVLQKASALALQLLVVCTVVTLGASLGPLFELHAPAAHLWSVGLTTLLLALDFGLIALALGASGLGRTASIAVTSAVAAGTYLIGSLASVLRSVHALRALSPFYWAVANGQLSRGASLLDVVVLVGVAAAGLAAASVLVPRLEVR